MDVEQLGFPDGHFDTVVGSLVFCSVPDPVRGMRELRRVCKPGGELRLLEHVRSEGWLGPIMDRLSGPLARRYGEYINRRAAAAVTRAGWQLESVENLLLDLVQLIRALPDKTAD
ncbi:MAG TPA: class I SAM-dependent methyltransferase, partial [Armatimonadota bacterium]|nr:class I SAM-dependent methyltransferase [Armatimonadota bacterium]